MNDTRDIDDILREVQAEFADDTPLHDDDLERLTAAWVAERSAPEMLDWPQDGLIDRVNQKIQTQIEKVEEMTGDMDPSTNFSLIVIQTELERWKFLVRSYLRARLAKLDKYTLHYLSPSQRQKLSPAEISFANRHQVLLYKHYMSSFLGQFPPHMRGINDTTVVSMVDQPDLETAVFIRTRRECIVKGRGVVADDKYEAVPGEVLIARWSDVRQLVMEGDAELV